MILAGSYDRWDFGFGKPRRFPPANFSISAGGPRRRLTLSKSNWPRLNMIAGLLKRAGKVGSRGQTPRRKAGVKSLNSTTAFFPGNACRRSRKNLILGQLKTFQNIWPPLVMK